MFASHLSPPETPPASASGFNILWCPAVPPPTNHHQ